MKNNTILKNGDLSEIISPIINEIFATQTAPVILKARYAVTRRDCVRQIARTLPTTIGSWVLLVYVLENEHYDLVYDYQSDIRNYSIYLMPPPQLGTVNEKTWHRIISEALEDLGIHTSSIPMERINEFVVSLLEQIPLPIIRENLQVAYQRAYKYIELYMACLYDLNFDGIHTLFNHLFKDYNYDPTAE